MFRLVSITTGRRPSPHDPSAPTAARWSSRRITSDEKFYARKNSGF